MVTKLILIGLRHKKYIIYHGPSWPFVVTCKFVKIGKKHFTLISIKKTKDFYIFYRNKTKYTVDDGIYILIKANE